MTSLEVLDRFVAQTAEVARIRVYFADARPPLVAIAKCASGAGLAAARRELRFFDRLAPRWSPSAPALLAALDDGDADDACVVLLTEDLGAAGYALFPGGLSEPQLHVMVDLLVELHARFWDDLQSDVMDFAHPTPSLTQSAQAWPPYVVAAHATAARAEATRFLSEVELSGPSALSSTKSARSGSLASPRARPATS